MVVGFIGCGNMGSAILEGIINSRLVGPKYIAVSDQNGDRVEELKNKYKVMGSTDNTKTAHDSDILFLCVKPNQLNEVIEKIKDKVKPDVVIVSIVAGRSIADIREAFGKEVNVIRVMPNTPALVGEAMCALSLCEKVKKKEYEKQISLIQNIFNGLGKCAIVPEEMMDAVTAVSGSSPAYVFMFIEAMADAAVRAGMTRKTAYIFAAQAVYGSAKMILETHKHPGQLKDMVCQPGGTTLEAIRVLESHKLRSSIFEAMKACVVHAKKM